MTDTNLVDDTLNLFHGDLEKLAAEVEAAFTKWNPCVAQHYKELKGMVGQMDDRQRYQWASLSSTYTCTHTDAWLLSNKLVRHVAEGRDDRAARED